MDTFFGVFRRFTPSTWSVDGITVNAESAHWEPNRSKIIRANGGMASAFVAAAVLSIAALSVSARVPSGPLTPSRTVASQTDFIIATPDVVSVSSGSESLLADKLTDFVPHSYWASAMAGVAAMPKIAEPDVTESQPLI